LQQFGNVREIFALWAPNPLTSWYDYIMNNNNKNELFMSINGGRIVCRKHTGYELGAQIDADKTGRRRKFVTSLDTWERMSKQMIADLQSAGVGGCEMC